VNFPAILLGQRLSQFAGSEIIACFGVDRIVADGKGDPERVAV